MDGISTSNSAIETATAWLGEFVAALALGKAARSPCSSQTNVIGATSFALTWDLRTASGAEDIAKLMTSALVPMPTVCGAETFSCNGRADL